MIDPRGVLNSGIERFALRVSLISIAKLIAFIRLANMSSTSMMVVGFRPIQAQFQAALAGLRRVSDKSIREQWCVWVTMRILLVMFLVFVALFGESRHELGSRG